MAGFPLGGGGHSRDAPAPSVPPVHPSDAAAASFLYAARAGAGLQLWQQHEQQHQHQHPFYAGSNIIRFSDEAAPSLTGAASSSSSRGTRGGGGGGSSGGGVSCQDCGNQAKKDCAHQRCRTCCKSRGFSCSTHVKSTWVPAAKRRERQQQLAVLAASAAATTAGAGPSSRDPTKRPRARLSVGTPTTSSGTHQSCTSIVLLALILDRDLILVLCVLVLHGCTGDQQMVTVAERFPREVSSEAVFRCVRLGPVDQAEAEVAYQTTVSIGGHVFKGILHDVGPHSLGPPGGGGAIEYHHFRHAGDGSSPPSTAAAGGEVGGGVANAIVSSAVVMDPYPTPGPYGAFPPGAAFFHGHPRQ
ncbi:hypothetical protein HU200_010496 [Digitaria exilis]|uniref:SHI n=1 Tax=Digitaria exilis TaxID=1010633 RepID=A0A835FIP3_9POAL|nr:hypothetical protein HU200_010496 [Digitaria exilis]